MTRRSALVIEPDESFASALEQALGPYGFSVERFVDGARAIERAQTNPPELILLSVEPKNVGYSICNKVKKHPTLKDIPLILMSSTATPEVFEQHRKLKTRADDYYLKKQDGSLDELLQRIDALVSLGEPVTQTGDQEEVEIPVEGVEEISLEEGDVALLEESGDHAIVPEQQLESFGDENEEKTRLTIESDIDDAFASLALGQETETGADQHDQFGPPTFEAVEFGEPPALEEPLPEPQQELAGSTDPALEARAKESAPPTPEEEPAVQPAEAEVGVEVAEEGATTAVQGEAGGGAQGCRGARQADRHEPKLRLAVPRFRSSAGGGRGGSPRQAGPCRFGGHVQGRRRARRGES